MRRIEALTGYKALHYLSGQVNKIKEVGTVLKASDPLKAIQKLLEEKTQLEKRVEHLENRMLVGIRNELMQKDEVINQVSFIGQVVEVPTRMH